MLNFPAGIISHKDGYSPPERESRPVAVTTESSALAAGCATLTEFCAEKGRLSAWRRLAKRANLPMQNPAFVSAVAEKLAQEDAIQIHYVDDGKRLAALFPLAAERGLFGRLKIVGEHELSEPGDVLCVDLPSALLLAEGIVSGKRVVDLDRLPSNSPMIGALQAAIAGKGKMSVRPAKATPTIDLDSCWKDPASQFNSGRRSDFRRAARRAAEFGKVDFEVLCPKPDEFDALFDEAINVEARSWKKEVGTAIAVDSCKEQFFRHYFRGACERGELRLAFMRIDGEIVAMQMALECLDRYWLFKIGFDEAFARCSPGTLLMLHTIGWAASRGLRAYELLGNVEPWIAQLWTRQEHDCARVRLYPYNLRGALAFAADGLMWSHRKLVRRLHD